jgi:hypothetical protein
MTGKIKRMIDVIIEKRSQGNPTIVNTTRTKLRLKGISLDTYTLISVDDPVVIEQLYNIAKEWDIKI